MQQLLLIFTRKLFILIIDVFIPLLMHYSPRVRKRLGGDCWCGRRTYLRNYL